MKPIPVVKIRNSFIYAVVFEQFFMLLFSFGSLTGGELSHACAICEYVCVHLFWPIGQEDNVAIETTKWLVGAFLCFYCLWL